MLKTLLNLILILTICIVNFSYIGNTNIISMNKINISKFMPKEKINLEKSKPKQEVKMYTKDLPNYIKPILNSDNSKTSITLFLPTISGDNLFPTTKYITSNNVPVRSTLDFLKTYVNIPKIRKLKMLNKILVIDFSSRNDFKSYNSDLIKILTNTLTSIEGVDRVYFLVGGRKVDTIIGNVNTTDSLANNSPKAYLSYDYNGRNLLVPKDILNMDTLISALKNDDGELRGTLPNEINLINYSLNNEVLTLNFTKEFSRVYEDRKDLQNMLIDSLVYSYTSFNNISQVIITVEKETINQFGDYDLSKPLIKSKIINP